MREFREFGHKLIDWIADYLESPERYPVLSTVKPDEIVNGLPAHGPEHGETIEHIFEDFERIILPGITHWNNPRFLAYFANTSSPPAILAELLSAALNANGFLWKVSPAVTELEIVTLRWLLYWFGLPQALVRDDSRHCIHQHLARAGRRARGDCARNARNRGDSRSRGLYIRTGAFLG